MQLKLPRPRRFLSQSAPARAAEDVPADDPWAGEDVAWEAEESPQEHPAAFVRFVRAVVLAALVGGLFWAAVVLLVLRLL